MPDNVTALLAMSGGGSVDPEKIAEVASEWLEENLATPSTPPIDSSLTVANAAADAKAAGDAIRAQNASLISPTAKQALLDCFAHVAWADDQGQEYYDALEAALFPEAELESISAVYTQSGTVYDTDSLDSLKADLVVTAIYGDGTTQTVPAESYTLSGTLTAGASTITVSYAGKTTTFTASVTQASDVTPQLSSFTPANTSKVGVEVANNTIQVYTKTNGSYQGVYASFTTEEGYSYKISWDATITSGKAKSAMTASNSSTVISGTSSSTLSASGHEEYTISHDATIGRLFLYCTWGTSEAGNVTFSNLKIIKFAEVE